MNKSVRWVLFVLYVPGVSVLHFVVTFALSFAYSLPYLFGGNQSNRVLGGFFVVLTFPLSIALHTFNPPPFVLWGLSALNSLLWGVVLCCMGRYIKRLLRRGAP